MNETPNHALQRTATAVTARASAAAFPPAMHGPRQPPPSLSLGSLGLFPMRSLVAAFLLVLPLYMRAEEPKPMPAKELAAFLGPVPANALTWTKYLGPDFEVFYGHANPPVSGDVGFYLGGFPKTRKPEPDSKTIEGKLGIFPVTWHRTAAKDGSISQNALIRLDDSSHVDIWLQAKSQQDVDQILTIISRLPTFTKKPKPKQTQ